MEEGLEDAMCVARTTVCQHVCTVLCGCVSSWSSHIRCRCKVVCSPVMFPLAPCDKLALPLTHPVLEKCVCTYLVSLPVLFSHLCWPSMTASTTPLNTCRGETLMSWYVHNRPHCAASTGAIACMHCCYIVLYQCHVC